ncbi:hypothetical protein RRG08_007211 [Elysia crispata]|uniref:Uncharacterized protein n=1 Tax=Elysia crispata TaxID=231223 RepID=A0AAE0ZTY7_9GAST|nr:hypothetical protein RRG08_007211 [Elysia crispata]
METIIIRRRWRWIGHVLRKEQDAIPRVAVQWRPEGHRKRGRPKTTWRRTVEAEAAAMGQSWGTLRMLAQDREQWKEFVAALIAYGKKGNTLRIAGPPTPHRRSTQVAGTSEQVVLLTQPTTKLPCQRPSTKVMHTNVHPGVLWEEPHQTQSISDDGRVPS